MYEQKFRTENDFIGECRIPINVLYGIQSLRGAENSSISGRVLGDETELVIATAEIKMASARANMELGVISKEQEQAIVSACREIIAGKHHDAFIIGMLEGSGATSMNMNFNEVIANLGKVLSGIDTLHPNDHVNISQSTNDVMPSAIKLAAYRMCDELLIGLEALCHALDEKATSFEDILHLGRTCLQDAQPMTLGQVFSGYASLVRRQIRNIETTRQDLLTMPLGGTAIGTGLGAPKGYIPVVFGHLRSITGLPVTPADNIFDAMQNADTFARFSSELKVAAVAIGKIANDLIILSSGPNGGFSELILPSIQAGSSIMPGKVNPVLPQMMCQIGFAVAGNDTCIAMATQQGQLEINAYEPVTASRLFDSLRMLGQSCQLFAEKCITGIEANTTRNEQNLSNSSAISTAFVNTLGYAQVAELVHQSQHRGKPFSELAIEQELVDKVGYEKVLRDSTINQ